MDRPAWPAEHAAEGRGQLVGGRGDGVRRYRPVVGLVLVPLVLVFVVLLLVVLVFELVVFELLVFVELLLQLVLRQLKALHFLNCG
ncbi:hypothetical protein [Streptomyces sp. NPDC058745]|uniref:hypothetical protein n=1 Tax=unclassified Streptomyces TaxID=2593676 RepID=UPI00367B3637